MKKKKKLVELLTLSPWRSETTEDFWLWSVKLSDGCLLLISVSARALSASFPCFPRVCLLGVRASLEMWMVSGPKESFAESQQELPLALLQKQVFKRGSCPCSIAELHCSSITSIPCLAVLIWTWTLNHKLTCRVDLNTCLITVELPDDMISGAHRTGPPRPMLFTSPQAGPWLERSLPCQSCYITPGPCIPAPSLHCSLTVSLASNTTKTK